MFDCHSDIFLSDWRSMSLIFPITYDGSLLKKCGILLNNLDSSFSFDIYITNNLDQEFKCTIFINIPTKLDDKSLYDGTITLKQNTNYIFYRYK